ncbi:MAG: co-chaperone GroES family protein [Bacteroidales bacterium]|nr:co-chaperone GroES family protein [Bacteroidales bacterium]
MTITADNLENLIVVGDKVLIKPLTSKSKTKSGLFLPPGYSEKEEIQHGYVVKVGPGIPIPYLNDDDSEPWKPKKDDKIRYIPLQPEVGDLAIFLSKGSVEIIYNDQKYLIVPQYSILLLERDKSVI